MIVVTGANGFVGRAVCAALAAGRRDFRAVSRSGGAGLTAIGDIGAQTDWCGALDNASAVIHLAARVHVMNETTADPLAEFRKVNVAATVNLARQAARAGVTRFVFVSSIKVNGEQTGRDRMFRAGDAPDPQDAYGVSKREAEDALRALAAETGLEVVIVRPPLVYGPGVRANFAALMRLVQRGLPIPLGAVRDNRRSLIGVDNLADLLIRCTAHPGAANATFLASDGEDLSTTDLITRIGVALGRPARLLAAPVAILEGSARLVGKGALAQRLLGSLRIDARETCATLQWSPPLTVDEGLRRAAQPLRADLR